MAALDLSTAMHTLHIRPVLRRMVRDSASARNDTLTREELPIGPLKALIGDANMMGYRNLHVSGTDASRYSGLSDLLRAGRNVGMTTTVTVPASRLWDENWIRARSYVNHAIIPFSGTPRDYDRAMGRDGAFDESLEDIADLHAQGVKFGLSFTLTQDNAARIDFVVRQAVELGAAFVRITPFAARMARDAASKALKPDALERLAAALEARRLGKQAGIPVRVDLVSAAELIARKGDYVPEPPLKALAEIAQQLVVCGDGKILPLNRAVDPCLSLGNLADGPLARLAGEWLVDGRAAALAQSCDLAWHALTAGHPNLPYTWAEEVAARTLMAPKTLRINQVA